MGPEELAALRDAGPVFRRHRQSVWVADPTLAREVLANRDGRYRDHSDFFHTGTGQFGPRAAQVAVGRAVRGVLREHLDASPDRLPALVDRLGPWSRWPDAATTLLHRYFSPVLLGPDTPAAVRVVVAEVVRRAVRAGARDGVPTPVRWRFRARVMRELVSEIRRRSDVGDPPPRDVLGAVVGAAGRDAAPRQLAEVFLSCLFATVGSIGFALSWSVLLLDGRPPGSAPVDAVRKALQLWPVAWLFGRTPTVPHELAGVPVTTRDDVVVCGWLVQRDPRHWTDATAFRPERWAGRERPEAYVPFGWGAHACTGAGLALDCAASALTALHRGHRVEVVRGDRPVRLAAALAPPPFAVRRTPERR